jgi:hypothetical protein
MVVGTLVAVGLTAAAAAAGLAIAQPWPAAVTHHPETHATAAQAPTQLVPDPIAAATRVARLEPSATRSTRLLSLGPGSAWAEVVDDGLPDDSVGAIRHQVDLRLESGAWRVKGDAVTYRCRPGRGSPQAASGGGWQAELCL